MPLFEGDLRPLPDARYAILAARWNPRITEVLVDGARRALTDNGIDAAQIDIVRVPGAWELPHAAAVIAERGQHAAIIALGCVVRGETRHYEHVADECARGLMRVALDTGVPVLNGVLAVEDEADAWARAGGARGNKGADVAQAAIAIAATMPELNP